jgi:hypothetical protein
VAHANAKCSSVASKCPQRVAISPTFSGPICYPKSILRFDSRIRLVSGCESGERYKLRLQALYHL